MMEKEAEWIASELGKIGPATVLNVGSSTLEYRQSGCVQGIVVEPHEAAGGKFLHLDMKPDEGVDLVGDLMDSAFRERVRSLRCDAVLCSNLLEHVTDPQKLCDLLVEVTPVGGYVVLTVPKRFPYHPDPIDTGFRPSVNQLETMMAGCELVRGEELRVRGANFARLLRQTPKQAAIYAVRTFLPFYKWQSWKQIVGYWPQTFSDFMVTCAVFRRVH